MILVEKGEEIARDEGEYGSSQVLGEAKMGHRRMEAITSQSNHTRIRRI